jgi:hypothetical protein
MIMSNAERQARWRARRAAELAALRQQAEASRKGSAGAAESAKPRAENEALRAELAAAHVTIKLLRRDLAEAQMKSGRSGRTVPLEIRRGIAKALHPDSHLTDSQREDILKLKPSAFAVPLL